MARTCLRAFICCLFVAGAAHAGGGTRVDVCHVPPGNPANFHTITISEEALSAHLAHGDLGGACNAACATLCDDGDACTIDDTGDCETAGCPTSPEAVDCDDQNECTADSCNPASGCVNTSRLGEACNDGQVCSGPDTCNASGTCQGPAIADCCLGDEQCSQNPCDQASCNLATNRCGNDPVVCNPPDLCTVSACSSDTGDCVNAPVVCPEGETCNPATGDCELDDVRRCPCWTENELDNTDGVACEDGTAGPFFTQIASGSAGQGSQFALVDFEGGTFTCAHRQGTVLRFLRITEDEHLSCKESILDECNARGISITVCVDADGDGFNDNSSTCGQDCNDADPATNPGAQEICGDGLDNNCNGEVDEGCQVCPCWTESEIHQIVGNTCNQDLEVSQDYFLTQILLNQPGPRSGPPPLALVESNYADLFYCAITTGSPITSLHITEEEFLGCKESILNECSAQGIPIIVCPDADGDGSQDSVCFGQDCNDADLAINPDAEEICGDGMDNNCTQGVDEYCCDADGDGFQNSSDGCDGLDCNDSDLATNPDAQEICGDGLDNNCSGSVDEGCE